jgi:putative cardiolipin synthase
MSLKASLMRWVLCAAAALACAPAARAEDYAFLADPIEAASARVELIRNAKKEIVISSYMIHNDRVGQTALALLFEAARAGKKIVLLTDRDNKIPPAVLQALVEAGDVEIHQYHPFDIGNPGAYLERMHDKIMIVDGEEMVTGDRNIANKYYGLTDQAFVSKDAYVKGSAAKSARAYVNEMVTSGEMKPIYTKKGAGSGIYTTEVEAAAKNMENTLRRLPKRILAQGTSWRDRVRPIEGIQFFSDVPGHKELQASSSVILDSIRNAKKSIVIENPYFILSGAPGAEEMRALLKQKAAEGVKITVITNSLKSTDNYWVWTQWTEAREFLANIGADVYEHPGARETIMKRLRKLGNPMSSLASLHAKSMVVDGEDLIITSHNADPRSFHLNTEVGVRIRDKQAAAEVLEQLAEEQKVIGYQRTVASGVLAENLKSCPALWRTVIKKTLGSQL